MYWLFSGYEGLAKKKKVEDEIGKDKLDLIQIEINIRKLQA